MSRIRKFPLVADNDTVVQQAKQMHLYENEDLITNIHGPYEDKVYDDVTQDYHFIPENPASDQVPAERLKTQRAGKTYAEMAREEARRDLKKKRQSYVTSSDFSKTSSHSYQPSFSRPVSLSKTVKPSSVSELARFTSQLRQDSYILAELPQVYSEPQNQIEKPKKNNYDFLKTSQIYNRQDYQEQKERQVAQELNLTPFDDAN